MAVSGLQAQTTYYWDPDGANAGFPAATGAWNGTNAFWNTDSSGGAGTLTATPLSTDDLLITGVTGGTITLSGARTANTLGFANTSNVTFTISNGGSLTLTGALTDTGAGTATINVINATEANAATVFTASSVALHELTLTGNTAGAQFLTTNYDLTLAVQLNVGAVNNSNTFRQTGGTISIGNGGYGLTLLEAGSNPTSGTSRYIMDGGILRAARIGVANGNGNNAAVSPVTRFAGTGVFEWNNGTIRNFASNGTLNIQNGSARESGVDTQYNTSKPLTIELSETGSRIFDVEGAGGVVNVTGSAQIVDKAGEAGTLTKSGLGTLNFTGGGTHAVSTWTGDTTVTQGTLATDYNRIAASTNTTLTDAYSADSKLVLNGGNYSLIGRGSASASSTTGSSSANSYTVTLSSTVGLVPGQTVSGTNIVAGTYIRRVISGTVIELSHHTAGGVALAASALDFGAASFTNTQTIDDVELQATTSTITVTPGSGTSTTLLNFGNVSGTGGLTKAGLGRLALTGDLTYTGGTAVSSGTLEFAPASGSSTLTGAITGSGAIVKSGAGTTILSSPGANANTFSGSLAVEGGILRIGTTSTSNVSNQGLKGVSSVSVSSGAELIFRNSSAIPNATPITLSGTVRTDTSGVSGGGFFNALGPLTLSGGTLVTSNGANGSSFQFYALNGTVTVTGTSASQINAGGSEGNAIHLTQTSGGSRTFDVADVTGSSAADLLVSARLINSSSALAASALVKTGDGTMVLTATNEYTGATTISAGKLLVTDAQALGTAAAGTTVASGASLELGTGLNYSTAEALEINGSGGSNGGALRGGSSSGTTTYAGPITAATNATIHSGGYILTLTGGIDKNGTVLTLTGGGTVNISGTGISGASANSDLVVDGTTANLDVANTYNGTTTVSGGTLLINGNQSDANGAISVASGATLGGSGTSGAATIAVTGGTLTGGTNGGVGALTFDNANASLTASTASTWLVDLIGGVADQIILSGGTSSINLTNFNLLVATDSTPLYVGQFWDIAMAHTITGTFGNLTSGTTADGRFNVSIEDGDTLRLTSAVPEPSTVIASGLLLTLGIWAARRRRNGAPGASSLGDVNRPRCSAEIARQPVTSDHGD